MIRVLVKKKIGKFRFSQGIKLMDKRQVDLIPLSLLIIATDQSPSVQGPRKC